MARPRKISDEAILDSAGEVIKRLGPQGVTFASIGAESGLAPATLVQRYGTRAKMLQAVLLRMWDHLDAQTAAADAQMPVTPAGAVALLASLSNYGDHDEYAEGLLLLREDMRDPALRLRGEKWGEVLAFALGRRLAEDPERQVKLGRQMASQWQGALLWWGFSREGSVVDAVVAALLEWCEIALAGEL
jgi:AcrR family transcriptional regulator